MSTSCSGMARVGPGSGRGRAGVGPRSGQGRARVGPGTGRGRARVGPRSGQGRARVRLGSGQGRARDGPGSGQGRAKIGPGSGQGRAKVGPGIGPGSGQGRARVGPGSGLASAESQSPENDHGGTPIHYKSDRNCSGSRLMSLHHALCPSRVPVRAAALLVAAAVIALLGTGEECGSPWLAAWGGSSGLRRWGMQGASGAGRL